MSSPSNNQGFSPLHYLFLMSFLYPRPIDKDPEMPEWWSFPDWNAALNESPNDLMKRFIGMALVQQCSDEKHLDYWYQEKELRDILRTYGIKPDGTKSVLIESALTLDKPETRLARDEFTLYECTNVGKGEIERYLKEISGGKTISPSRAMIWILSAAMAGFIGNRADAILLQAAGYLLGQGKENGTMPSSPASFQDDGCQEPIDAGMMIWLDPVTENDESADTHNHLYLDLEQVGYNMDKKVLVVSWSVGLDIEDSHHPEHSLIIETNLWLGDLELIFTESGLVKKHIRRAQRQNIKLPAQAVYSQTERFHCAFTEVIGGEIDIRCRFKVQCKDSRDHSVRDVTENINYLIDWDYEEDICWDD